MLEIKSKQLIKILLNLGKVFKSPLDVNLQELGEKLMANKIGSIVAIEPSTGEILAMVSAPSYNPSLLTGKIFQRNSRN